MKRRGLLTLPLLFAGCGLSERPYAERRQWPLLVSRPTTVPPRANGRVLLLRAIAAAPGLEVRGLQTVQADGSIRTEFYEEWAVPPAEGVEDALRRWLASAGLFAAVLAPGSRVTADFVMEGELSALWSIAASQSVRATIAVTLSAQPSVQANGTVAKVLLQQSFDATAPLEASDPAGETRAACAALARDFGNIEAALATFVPGT